MTYANFFMKV